VQVRATAQASDTVRPAKFNGLHDRNFHDTHRQPFCFWWRAARLEVSSHRNTH